MNWRKLYLPSRQKDEHGLALTWHKTKAKCSAMSVSVIWLKEVCQFWESFSWDRRLKKTQTVKKPSVSIEQHKRGNWPMNIQLQSLFPWTAQREPRPRPPKKGQRSGRVKTQINLFSLFLQSIYRHFLIFTRPFLLRVLNSLMVISVSRKFFL